jgi:hypothetical protein
MDCSSRENNSLVVRRKVDGLRDGIEPVSRVDLELRARLLHGTLRTIAGSTPARTRPSQAYAFPTNRPLRVDGSVPPIGERRRVWFRC